MFRIRTVIVFLVWVFGLASCTPRAVREAQEVVAQADSLRAEGMIYGIDAGDSLALAQAYETLGRTSRYLLPITNRQSQITNTYAHACYHYGRLLREKDDPVGAMECFINATHSRTRDYHILGRVYSNMGSICHLANEYSLSYDMFERSADMFLLNGDTLSYYYGLNDMAFELIKLEQHSKADSILYIIEHICSEEKVLNKVLETQLILSIYEEKYSASIKIADSLQTKGFVSSSTLMAKARAFYCTQNYDSASYYAYLTLNASNSLFDKDNAYYILIHCDSVYSGNQFYALSADRADVEKELENLHGKLTQAAQLLELDIARKPDLGWLYAILSTIITIGGGIGLYVVHKRKKYALLTQQVQELEAKKNEVSTQNKIIATQQAFYKESLINHINQECTIFRNSDSLQRDLCWNDYPKMCEIANSHFYMLASKLQQTNYLNETEIRLCVLVLIGLSRTEISDILPYALSSVGKLKDQTAKKLGTTGKNLREYLLKLTIWGSTK